MDMIFLQDRIVRLLSLFVTEVDSYNALDRYDINKLSEGLLIPLFKEIFDCSELVDLNKEKINYAAIDLGDKVNKIAFQITSDSTSDKVIETIEKFTKNKEYLNYDKLFVYIITRKQGRYTSKKIDDAVNNLFNFSKEDNIIDYRDLIEKIKGFDIEKLSRVRDVLEKYFNYDNFIKYYIPRENTEQIYLNYLEVIFPSKIYTAPLRDDIDTSDDTRKINKAKKIIQKLNIKSPVDWIYWNGIIITFHDISNKSLALNQIINESRIEKWNVSEFCNISDNHYNQFSFLLRRCLQQKLYKQDIKWQDPENIFIFCGDISKGKRKMAWKGIRNSQRIVFEVTMKENKPYEILYCKHLAFKAHFRMIQKEWYLIISPTWFFSFDGYRKNDFCADNIKWLKRAESNSHIYNQFKFIAYILSQQKTMLDNDDFLEFREPLSFHNSPSLNDTEWNDKGSVIDTDDINQSILNLEDL